MVTFEWDDDLSSGDVRYISGPWDLFDAWGNSQLLDPMPDELGHRYYYGRFRVDFNQCATRISVVDTQGRFCVLQNHIWYV